MPDYHVPHLNGCTVAILADGQVLPQMVVTGGIITLAQKYAKVTIGIPIKAQFETLNIEVASPGQSLQGRKIKIGNVLFRFVQTVGGWIGPDKNHLHEAFPQSRLEQLEGFDFDDHTFSGDIREPLGAGYEDGGRIFYEQRDPLPVTIGAVIPEAAIGGSSGV